MSYSWIGAPAEFNGTNAELGGDSSEFFLVVLVPPKVPSMYHVYAHVNLHVSPNIPQFHPNTIPHYLLNPKTNIMPFHRRRKSEPMVQPR